MKLCALSVDLDEIPCYHAIHGLPMPEGPSAHGVYALAVPRYLDLLKDLGVPCTFFVVGRDLVHDVAVQGVRALHQAGHELGNHTQNHRYDLVRQDTDTLRAEVLEAVASITRAAGVTPTGFRAPGYTITDELFDVLADAGVRYDSSVFPCPSYYAAKSAAIAGIHLAGRRSRSIVDTPAVMTAPADPYVPSRPYWNRAVGGESGLMELPIGVTRYARLPFIGTYVMMAGSRRVDWLTAQVVGRPLINLELHGIDLMDATDGLDALRPHQMDVRIPLASKLSTLRRVVNDLRTRGYRFVTLHDAAEAFRQPAAAV